MSKGIFVGEWWSEKVEPMNLVVLGRGRVGMKMAKRK